MILDRLTTPIWAALIGAALLALGVQSWRLSSTAKELTQLQAQQLKRQAQQTTAVNLQLSKDAQNVNTHAQGSQQNAAQLNQATQPLASALSAELQRIDGLRVAADRRAAGYRAQAEAGSAAYRSLADRCEALDRSLVQGLTVVAQLRTTVERRDAEVIALRRQIDIDRKFMETDSQETRSP